MVWSAPIACPTWISSHTSRIGSPTAKIVKRTSGQAASQFQGVTAGRRLRRFRS